MGWKSFEVRPRAAVAVVAEQLRRQFELVAAIRLPVASDVTVCRHDRQDGARFYFSSAAVELFRTLVQFHGAKPCRAPPASRDIVRLRIER